MMPDEIPDDVETAREDLILVAFGFIAAMLTAGLVGAVVWNNLDKFLTVVIATGIWGGFAVVIYAVKSRLW